MILDTNNTSNKRDNNSAESSQSLRRGGDLGGCIKVHCPATVANLVCGFDILGLALNEPYDIMEVKLLDEPKVIIHNRDNFNLPTEAEKNVAGVVFLSAMEKTRGNTGLEGNIEKNINTGREL